MNTLVIIVGASIYILVLFLVVGQFGKTHFSSKHTKLDKVKPLFWLFILINMLVGPFVLLGKSIGVIGGVIL